MRKIADVVRRLDEWMKRGGSSLPLTSIQRNGDLDPGAHRAYPEQRLAAGPDAVLLACGAGEFTFLDEEEYRAGITVATDVAHGRRPVVAGIGYGWARALRFARIAEDAGAEATLVLPHCSIQAPQGGRVEQLRRTGGGTRLPLIARQRDQVAPNGFLLFNGAATAELQARAYAGIGVRTYASAVHAFAPEIAQAFFEAPDKNQTNKLLRGFHVPLVELRDSEARLRRPARQGCGPTARTARGPRTCPAHRARHGRPRRPP